MDSSNILLRDWSDGSDVKSIVWSSRGPGLNSQHLHDGAQPLLTLDPGAPMSSYDWHQACIRYTYIHTDKTLLYIKIQLNRKINGTPHVLQ